MADGTEGGLTPAEELEILAPDADVVVTDPDEGAEVTLTLREYRFLEGLRVQPLAAPLIAALTALSASEADGAKAPDPAEIDVLLGEHADLWLELIARASGRDAGWLGRLADEDARAVSGAMWTANGSFFFRRIVEHAAAKVANKRSPSPGSSTPSPTPDTGATTTSESE